MAASQFDGTGHCPGAAAWASTLFRSSEIGSMPLRIAISSITERAPWKSISTDRSDPGLFSTVEIIRKAHEGEDLRIFLSSI